MITIVTDDDTYSLDVDVSMTIENLAALLEADSGIPAAQQALYYNGELLLPARTLESYSITSGDLLMLRRNAPAAQAAAQGQGPSSDVEQAETLRLQVLGDPQLLSNLQRTRPELAAAAQSSPERFRELLIAEKRAAEAAAMDRERAEAELAAADEFDVEAQRRIEEAIRQEAVMENLNTAMEYTPEVFSSVNMLYIDTQVNGHAVKAFVDSGAQATIMSPECAERCGIMRLVDTRFAGIARGVGTAKILGRVHSAQIRLGTDLFLPCSFTIMEGKGPAVLFGLDMLKRFQAIIDLNQNCLIVNGKKIDFLSEHELPASAREEETEGGDEAAAAVRPGPSSAAVAPTPGESSSAAVAAPPAAAPAAAASSAPVPSAQAATAPASGAREWPAESIQTLRSLGATLEQAKALLDAANGNVDVAGALLFQ